MNTCCWQGKIFFENILFLHFKIRLSCNWCVYYFSLYSKGELYQSVVTTESKDYGALCRKNRKIVMLPLRFMSKAIM